MKDLPVLKKINITNLTDLNSVKLKKDLDTRKLPLVLVLQSIPDFDLEKLIYVESRVVSMVKSVHFPYPIYFLSQNFGFNGRITCFTKIEEIPHFFPTRSRNFTKIHQKLVLYNTIAEREFDCLNFEKSYELISSYSILNKELSALYQETKSQLEAQGHGSKKRPVRSK